MSNSIRPVCIEMLELRTLLAASPLPFHGIPFTPDQTIQAEDFDTGGQGIAYNDRDAINRGTSNHRPGEGVDLYTRSFGITVGYAQVEEYLEYTIDVPTAGTYDLSFRVANPASGAIVQIAVQPDSEGRLVNIPNTGSWSNYQTVTVQGVNLIAGVQQLQLYGFDAATNGSVGDFDWLKFTGPTNAGGDTQAPTAPSGFHPEEVTPTTFTLRWNPSTDNVGVTFYELQRDGQPFASTHVSENFYSVAGAQPDTTYQFSVVARDQAGNRSSAATTTVTTVDASQPDDQPPTAPPDFAVYNNSADRVSLIWGPSTDNVGVSHYELSRDGVVIEPEIQYAPDSFEPDQQFISDSGLQSNTHYNYSLIAVDFQGNRSSASTVGSLTDAGPHDQFFFNGPHNAGDTIQAEDYDTNGGEGFAFHDNDAINRGTDPQYRASNSSDIGPDIYARSFGRSIGYVQAGEWLEYTVNVPTTGTYDLQFRAANPAAGARIHFELNGTAVSGPVTVPNTGSWSTYATVTTSGATLAAGTHVLRLSFDTAASNGSVGDFDWIRFSGPTGTPSDSQAPTRPTITSTNYGSNFVTLQWTGSTDNVGVTGYQIRRGGTILATVGPDVRTYTDNTVQAPYTYNYGVRAIDAAGNRSEEDDVIVDNPDNPAQSPFNGFPFNPGQVIQVEDFDNGGDGIAYHDNDPGNRGTSTYRLGTGVDLYTGANGLINAGYVQPGEYLEYTLNIPTAAIYDFSVRVSHVQSGARFRLELVDGNLSEHLTSLISVPNTGSWNTYATVSANDISLPAGVRQVRLYFDTPAANGSVGNYDWLMFRRQ